MDILAIVAARNESHYLELCLPYLFEQGIRVAVIDNGSKDGTAKLLRRFSGRDLLRIEVYPYPGYYDWQGLLRKKEALRREIGGDWTVHHDADEIMESCRWGEGLAEGIRRVDAAGFDAINFDEFVFVPEDERRSYLGQNYYRRMRYYYFFEPRPLRLVRAFRNSPSLSNVESGGHTLAGDKVRIYPRNFAMRHYICLSAEHGRRKYLGRSYSPQELAIGWHANRIIIDESNFVLPDPSRLSRLPYFWGGQPSTRQPRSTHFWQWARPQEGDKRARTAAFWLRAALKME